MSRAEVGPTGLTLQASAVLAELSASVHSKARTAARRGYVTPDPNPDLQPRVWWVRSLRREVQTSYRVSTDLDAGTGELTWINCTCAHGQKTGAGYCRCYHVGAVLLALTEERS